MKQHTLATHQDESKAQTAKTAPLSFAQERLWYLDQLHERVATYNRPANVRIRGPLNFAALEMSLQAILRRHESLRMRFLDRGPCVEIGPAQYIPLELVDLTTQTGSQRSADDLVRREATRPFDLQESPPIRLRLLRLAPDEHLLLCTVHHIVFDGWSQSIFLRELADGYAAHCQGRDNPLPELNVQYTDIVAKQRRLLDEGQLDKHIEYWQRQLSGSRSTLGIPTDYVRPANPSEAGAQHCFCLPRHLFGNVREFNARHRVTLFMTLLAAFQALLYRYTGQSNVVVGAPIAGRTHKDMEDLIGLFINTLPLRLDLSGNPTFADLVARIRRSALEAYEHQEVPLQTIIQEAVSGGSSADSALFHTLFNLQPAIEPVQAEDAIFSCAAIRTETAKADLSMDLKFSTDGVFGNLEYRTELFAPATIQDMSTHWIRILDQVTQCPDTRLDELVLTDERDRAQVLVEWNCTQRDYSSDIGVHELFEERARLAPDKTVVVLGDVALTYAELDRRANQLAHYLLRSNNSQTNQVLLLANRSIEMIVGILGILKAGACYIPVDATTPTERVRFILDETQARLLTTHVELHDGLSKISSPHICLERDGNSIQQESTSRPAVVANGDDLAYIIYTSGSTGQPKGVMVEHHSVVNYAHTVADVLGVTHEDRVLQFASIGFDASIEEIFGALTSGATLVLRDEEAISSTANFLDRIATWGITFASLPTAFWHELVHQMRMESRSFPPCLKTIVIGGQKASSSAIDAWQSISARHVNLFNSYGPTETTVVTTIAKWTETTDKARREFPIGRPIPNSSVFVLDSTRQPVPVGVAGELYIAGRGVARGYFNRPELTAQCFTRCLFDSNGSARMYRTGDQARWLRDGQLEFLGRFDNQVKVRGFRVEPQEVASNLENLAAIRQCVVIPREDPAGEVQLTAYVVAATDPSPTSRELRTALAKQLPDYMIPTAFVTLDAFPLTKNGKVDHTALPLVTAAAPESTPMDPPRTALQRQIADIWQEVLGVTSVGLHDQFFELGGHSLRAMQMIARLTDRFEVDIPLRLIFQKPTLIELAEDIQRRKQESNDNPTRDKAPSIAAISRERRRQTA